MAKKTKQLPIQRATIMLLTELDERPRKRAEIMTIASRGEKPISLSTLERVKRELNVVWTKEDGEWYWALPPRPVSEVRAEDLVDEELCERAKLFTLAELAEGPVPGEVIRRKLGLEKGMFISLKFDVVFSINEATLEKAFNDLEKSHGLWHPESQRYDLWALDSFKGDITRIPANWPGAQYYCHRTPYGQKWYENRF